MSSEQYINIPLAALKRHEHSLYLRLDKNDVEAMMEDLGKHFGAKTAETMLFEDSSMEDVGNVLWQTGMGRVAYGGEGRIELIPAEHEVDKENPCHLTLGYLEGILSTVKKKPVNLRRVRCVSDGENSCEYEINVAERRITQTRYAAGAAYRIPDEQRAFREFKTAVEEGRRGIAVTPYTEDKIQGTWDIPGLECYQVGEGADVAPWALGTLETVWHNFIKQNPESAVLFTAAEYLRTQVEDGSISAILRKLGEKIQESHSTAFIYLPEGLRGRYPLAEKFFTELAQSPAEQDPGNAVSDVINRLGLDGS